MGFDIHRTAAERDRWAQEAAGWLSYILRDLVDDDDEHVAIPIAVRALLAEHERLNRKRDGAE